MLVVALHAALLAALWLHRAPPLQDPGERRTITLRIVTPPKASREPPPTALPRLTAPPPAVPVVVMPPVPPIVPGNEPPAASPTPPIAAAPPPAEAPRTTLRLLLPPGYAASTASRNPALTDPRSNTPRLTLEDRIADATGGAGAWVEEPVENHAQSVGALGEYRTVMRRGTTCVEIFRSRISDFNAFNSSVAPSTIAMQGKPYKCK
jgi:hypothetical protein